MDERPSRFLTISPSTLNHQLGRFVSYVPLPGQRVRQVEHGAFALTDADAVHARLGNHVGKKVGAAAEYRKTASGLLRRRG